MNKFNRKNEDIEISYRGKHSNIRNIIFYLLQGAYKFLINGDDYRLKMLINELNKYKPKKVLEIGSGTLPLYKFLPGYLKNIEYHICDVNKKKIEHISKNFPNITAIYGDALELPYECDNFDFIISKGVWHHIDDSDSDRRRDKKNRFLKETRRVLIDGGVNFVMDVDYNPKRFRDFFWHKIHQLILSEGEHNFSTASEVEDYFKESGFNCVYKKEFEVFKGLYYYVCGTK